MHPFQRCFCYQVFYHWDRFLHAHTNTGMADYDHFTIIIHETVGTQLLYVVMNVLK